MTLPRHQPGCLRAGTCIITTSTFHYHHRQCRHGMMVTWQPWCVQEVAAQALQASQALKAERRRTLAVEKQLKASNEARAEAAAAAVRAAEELEAGRAEGERSKRLAEERAALVVQAENAAVEARQQCDMQVGLAAHIGDWMLPRSKIL